MLWRREISLLLLGIGPQFCSFLLCGLVSVLTELSWLQNYSCELIYCDWFFQIDFGDASGSTIDFGGLDSDTTAGFESSRITVEGEDINWGISTVESPGETGNEVYQFQD
jgi:hypothetical protein